MPTPATLSPGVEPLGMTRRQASLRVSAQDTRAIHTPVRGQFAGVALLTIQALARELLRPLTTFMPERMVTSTATTRRLEIGLRTAVSVGRGAPITRTIFRKRTKEAPIARTGH